MPLLNLLKEEKIRMTEPKAEEFEIALKVSQARTHLKVQLKNSYFMLVLAPSAKEEKNGYFWYDVPLSFARNANQRSPARRAGCPFIHRVALDSSERKEEQAENEYDLSIRRTEG